MFKIHAVNADERLNNKTQEQIITLIDAELKNRLIFGFFYLALEVDETHLKARADDMNHHYH